MRTATCAILVAALGLAGCDATVELTKAPFDASTHISDGLSNATSEFTQPTQELTSSTTPGALFGNNPAKNKMRAELFAAHAYENIRGDIARGEGEYLTSLATLAGVPASGLAEFRVDMRKQYASLYDGQLTPRESAARVVNTAWSAGHGNAQTAQPRAD